MQLYDVRCPVCGQTEEIFRKLSDRDNVPSHCGVNMKYMLSTPSIQPDNTCYKSMVTGEMITSRTQHKNHLKQHGVIEVGNESMERKPDLIAEKRAKETLRRDIAARLDSISQ